MENLHDWINSAVLIILGYIIFAQSGILKNMKAYIDIFKIDEVKKYVEMKEETIMTKSISLLENNDKVQQMIKDSSDESIDAIRKIYIDQMGDEHMELVNFAVHIIASQPKSKRKDIIENGLPLTKRYVSDIISDIENNVI